MIKINDGTCTVTVFVFLCSYRKKHPVKLLFQSIFIMVILKKSTECTKTTFKNVYKYTFKRVWFKYVAISKQSVSFTKPRLGPAFASYFSNLLLTNILSPYKRKWQLSICEGGRGDANNPNYNPAFIHIQSAFCQNHNSSAFKT